MVDVTNTMARGLDSARRADTDGGTAVTAGEVDTMVIAMMQMDHASPDDIRAAMKNQKLDPATRAAFESAIDKHGPADVAKLRRSVGPDPALDKKVADAEKKLAATKPDTPQRKEAEEALAKAKHERWDALAQNYFALNEALNPITGKPMSPEDRKELQALAGATLTKLMDEDKGSGWAKAGNAAASAAGNKTLANHYHWLISPF